MNLVSVRDYFRTTCPTCVLFGTTHEKCSVSQRQKSARKARYGPNFSQRPLWAESGHLFSFRFVSFSQNWIWSWIVVLQFQPHLWHSLQMVHCNTCLNLHGKEMLPCGVFTFDLGAQKLCVSVSMDAEEALASETSRFKLSIGFQSLQTVFTFAC